MTWHSAVTTFFSAICNLFQLLIGTAVYMKSKRLPILRSALSLILLAVLISGITGCGGGGQSGQAVAQYPTGQTRRVDTLSGGKKTNSRWYTPSGELIFETHWSPMGDGLDYSLYPDGNLHEKITMKNNVRHGTAWTYDQKGNCTSTDKFLNGIKQ